MLNKNETTEKFINMIYSKKRDSIICITESHNFLFYSASTLEKERHILGFNEEILDIKFLNETKILVASQSETISLIDLQTKVIFYI